MHANISLSRYIQELRYIRAREEQIKILRLCHVDPTAGHLGERKTIARITERFMWRGVVKDVKNMVWYYTRTLHNALKGS